MLSRGCRGCSGLMVRGAFIALERGGLLEI